MYYLEKEKNDAKKILEKNWDVNTNNCLCFQCYEQTCTQIIIKQRNVTISTIYIQ